VALALPLQGLVFMARLLEAVRRLIDEEDGQDLLEYGLLAVLIAVVLVSTLGTLGNTVLTVFWQPIVQNF
jgi:Flp pilus assembly pilin Flp